MTHMNLRFVTCIVFVCALMLMGQSSVMAVSIKDYGMTNKTDGGDLLTEGYAQAGLDVEFVGEATCNCEIPNLTYTWYFDDGSTADGKTVGHAFVGGKHKVYLNVHCNGCRANRNSSKLTVHAISGIEITNAGSNWRLCFDEVRNVAARTLPVGVDGSDKIDYVVDVEGCYTYLLNSSEGDLSEPTQWPQFNSSWGENALYASIDSSYPGQIPDVSDQNGELRLTGAASYVSTIVRVEVFFQRDGKQNPDGTVPNWFYYWTQTSANYGEMNYYDPLLGCHCNELVSGSHCCPVQPYPAYVGDDARGDYPVPDVGQGKNAGKTLKGIDSFAHAARHEWKHYESMTAWWNGPGGWKAAQPTEDKDDWENGIWIKVEEWIDGKFVTKDVFSVQGDHLPDALEAMGDEFFTEEKGGPFNPEMLRTFEGEKGIEDDCERYTHCVQEDWKPGTVKEQDWANPGSQWE